VQGRGGGGRVPGVWSCQPATNKRENGRSARNTSPASNPRGWAAGRRRGDPGRDDPQGTRAWGVEWAAGEPRWGEDTASKRRGQLCVWPRDGLNAAATTHLVLFGMAAAQRGQSPRDTQSLTAPQPHAPRAHHQPRATYVPTGALAVGARRAGGATTPSSVSNASTCMTSSEGLGGAEARAEGPLGTPSRGDTALAGGVKDRPGVVSPRPRSLILPQRGAGQNWL
jgi:hypothetical protein